MFLQIERHFAKRLCKPAYGNLMREVWGGGRLTDCLSLGLVGACRRGRQGFKRARGPRLLLAKGPTLGRFTAFAPNLQLQPKFLNNPCPGRTVHLMLRC